MNLLQILKDARSFLENYDRWCQYAICVSEGTSKDFLVTNPDKCCAVGSVDLITFRAIGKMFGHNAIELLNTAALHVCNKPYITDVNDDDTVSPYVAHYNVLQCYNWAINKLEQEAKEH